jgi:hypothetical protein
MFPEELPYRIIRMFSFIGDTILDPFVGSGTTLKVAKSLFREGIGYEPNESFREIIENKIQGADEDHLKDFQYLLFKLYQNEIHGEIQFNFEKQRQKGIVILKDKKNSEIILDYLLFEDETRDKEDIVKEFKSKFEENTVQCYLKEKEGWNNYYNYIIVINANKSNKNKIMTIGRNQLKDLGISKKIQFVDIDYIISDKFQITQFFK